MPSYNRVILIGNLTRDPELRHLPNGSAVCEFGLAVNDRFQNKATGQWEDRPNFVDCSAFGKTAENIAKFFTKGRPIFTEGKLRLEQWEDRQTGNKRSKLKVVVDTWQFVDSDKGEPSTRSATRQGQPKLQPQPAIDEDDIPW